MPSSSEIPGQAFSAVRRAHPLSHQAFGRPSLYPCIGMLHQAPWFWKSWSGWRGVICRRGGTSAIIGEALAETKMFDIDYSS